MASVIHARGVVRIYAQNEVKNVSDQSGPLLDFGKKFAIFLEVTGSTV